MMMGREMAPSGLPYSTGMVTGAPLSLIKKTRIFAGSEALAFFDTLMDIARGFHKKVLSCRQGFFSSPPLYLHYDSAFQYIDESIGIVAMRGG